MKERRVVVRAVDCGCDWDLGGSAELALLEPAVGDGRGTLPRGSMVWVRFFQRQR